MTDANAAMEERLAELEEAVVRLGQLVEHLYTSQGIPVPSGDSAGGDAEVRALIAAGDMIGAIKRYREVTGVGLVEAKRAVEDMRG